MADGTRMQQRRATEAVWTTSEYVLAPGELGVTTDTGIIKIGNGTSPWSELDIAFGSEYLPLLGKAADSELLDGIGAAGFLQAADATTAPTADKILRRLSDGRAQAVTATSGNDLINYTQWAAANTTTHDTAVVDARKSLVIRTLTDATTTVTLAASDVGGVVMIANSSLTVQRLITIPTNATAAIVVGSIIDICSTDAGNLKLSPAGGVTLSGKPHIFGQFSMMRIVKTATDAWVSVPMGSRRGRTPKIRLTRTGVGLSYPANTEVAIPYDTMVAADTFNPDEEWFGTPPSGFSVERRTIIKQDGEYMVIPTFQMTNGNQSLLRVSKMTASNTIGTRLASSIGFVVGEAVWCGRLAANEGIGAVIFSAGATGTDSADGANGNPCDIRIIRIGD
jgi:hypothetical protein